MKPPSRPRPALGKTAPKPPSPRVAPPPAKRPGTAKPRAAGPTREGPLPDRSTRTTLPQDKPEQASAEVTTAESKAPVATVVPLQAREPQQPRSVVSTGLQARLAERELIDKARLRRRLYWVAGVAVTSVLMVWAVFFSPLFALDPEQITVEGTADTVDRKTVVELVNDNHGVPLPRLNTTALRLQIKDVRGVQDVTLRRDWPRGLTVSITARQPVVAVPDEDEGGYLLLDSEAIQVGRAAKAPKDLPVISVPIEGDNQVVLESVLVVLEAIPDKLGADVRAVSANTQDDITLRLRGGGKVIWGDSSSNALKASVLAVLREQAGNSRNYDVSAPSAPITW
ncbi:cell division protein FtsQ [Micrococcales bacterium KH10]|nr:cell division protein FtsQ [Micrococcales bacterium KH10]